MLQLTRGAVAAFIDVVRRGLFRLRPHGAHIQQRGEEVVVQRAGRIGEHAVFGATHVHVQCTHPPDQNRHLWRGQRQKLGTVDQQLCRGDRIAGLGKVAETVGDGFKIGNGVNLGLFKRGIAAARCEGHGHVVARVLGGFLDPGGTGQHDQVSDRDFFVPRLRVVEVCADRFQHAKHFGQLIGFVHRPVFLRCQTDARAICTAALVGPAEGRGRAPSGGHQFLNAQPRLQHFGFQRCHICVIDQRMRHGGDRVLPDQLFAGNVLAQIAGNRSHVAVGQLEPCTGKCVGKFLGVFMKTRRDFEILGVFAQREVRGEHDRRVTFGRIMRIRHGACGVAVLWGPLHGTGRAFGHFPLEPQQVVEVSHVPACRGLRPCAFKPAGQGVDAVAGLVLVGPAKALSFQWRGFGIGAGILAAHGTMRLTKGVTTRDQRDRFIVVHRHPAKGVADVIGRALQIGFAVRPFGVHIDQAHLHSGQRVFQRAFLAVAFVAQPFVLGAPIDILFGFPTVHAATGEAECFQPHRFQRDIAAQDDQVTPGNLVAVFLLDRPQQAARLVEVGVIGPAVERRETLRARAGPATAIRRPVGACRVPCHTNEKRAIVTIVRRPPVLRIRHQRMQVSLDRVNVELLELFGIVKVWPKRVRIDGVLVQQLEVQLVRPPFVQRPRTAL